MCHIVLSLGSEMKRLLIFILLFVTSTLVYGQDSYLTSIGVKRGKHYSLTDSTIVTKLNRTASDSAYSNANLSEDYSRISISISEQIEYVTGLIDAYLNMSVAKIYLNQMDSSLNYVNRGLDISKKKHIQDRQIACYDMRGSVYSFMEKYDLAVTDYLSAIKLAEKTGSDRVIKSYSNLGFVFNKTGNDKKAEHYIKLSIEAGKEKDQPSSVASSLNNLGLLEKKRGNYDKALEYFYEGLEYAKKKGFKARESELLYNISNIYFNRGEVEKGMDYFERSLEISKVNGQYISLAIGYSTMSQNLFDLGRKKEAREMGELALKYALLSGNYEVLIESYDQLALMSYDSGNSDDAYYYLTYAFAYKDSLQLSEINNAIAAAENQYEQEKKDLRVEMERAQEKEINEQKLHTRDVMLWFSGGGLLIVIGGIFYLFRINRKVKSRNKIVEHQKTEIETQHKEITDSINYAERIQRAIITNDKYWEKLSKDHFVFFQPKDVVSGDFHWVYNDDDRKMSVWAVADCTGHGVPGAFMSMLGIGFLNEIVIDDKRRDPAEILNELRRKILNALDSESSDGMDIALCVWDKNSNELHFSGANNGLYLIRKVSELDSTQFKSVLTPEGSELGLAELDADKMPIGKTFGVPPSFKSRTIKVLKDDVVVLFTDGYADQFGGPDNKKYKYKKLKELLLQLQGNSSTDQLKKLQEEFYNWKGDNEQTDDVCMVSVKIY